MKKSFIIFLIFCLPIEARPPTILPDIQQGLEYLANLEIERQYQAYFDKLAFIESSNTWDTVNQIGAMGKYQFLATTLQEMGVYVTPQQFALNPLLFGPEKQDSIIRIFTLKNEAQLKDITNAHPERSKFDFLAAAHIAGVKGAKDYFIFGFDRTDGNGTKISEYLKKFE